MSLKLGTGLGVLALVMVGSFYFNDMIQSGENIVTLPNGEGSRSLASVQPMSESIVVSKKLVTKLAESEGLDKSQKAMRPSKFDKFAFEELQGRYSVEMKSGKIMSFQFDVQTNSNPLVLPKPVEFLNSYKDLWAVKFVNIIKSNNSNEKNEIFDLHDKSNQKVGSVVFEKDVNGLWKGMEFIQK
jgi:hypothetical protein